MSAVSLFSAGGAGAGAGAGGLSLHMASLRSMSSAPPKPKRARAETMDEEEEMGKPIECPKEMHEADFSKLQDLVTKHRDDPYLRLLPMPSVAHDLFKIPKPQVATVMDTAINCLMKTSTHAYSTNEIEIRDLSKTLNASHFPKFYEGPSHAHMLPDGGPRVIAHPVDPKATELPALPSTGEWVGAASGAGAGAGSNKAGSVMTDE